MCLDTPSGSFGPGQPIHSPVLLYNYTPETILLIIKNSQCIDEVGTFIAQLLDFIRTLPFHPPISSTTGPPLILLDQQESLQDTASQQEEREVRDNGAVAGQESGGVRAAVDIRGDDAVEISPPDDEADGDAALVDSLDVVGSPGDGVADAGVDTQGGEVDTRVLDRRVACACERVDK